MSSQQSTEQLTDQHKINNINFSTGHIHYTLIINYLDN